MRRPTKKCKFCKKEIIKPMNFGRHKWEEKLFCSRQCSSKNQINTKKKPHTENWKKQNSILHTGKKNSIETRRKMAESKRGRQNPNWKGGISTQYQLERASMECKLWREAVFQRDGYVCIWCHKKGGWNKEEQRQIVLNADHIKPFISFPELRFAIDNGRTLCEECHRTTETYGARAHKFA